MLYTYQDFEEAQDVPKFVLSAIERYKQSDMYQTACIADEYDKQRNTTITETIPKVFNLAGMAVEDVTASNNKIPCNLFNRLNTQRCMYSLGNGISFVDPYEAAQGKSDTTKERLGKKFDHTIAEAGYYGLIHGVAYLFWDLDHAVTFKATEFVPIEDEHDGSMRAGIRFWQLDTARPLNAVLYEKDGYTTFRQEDGRFTETKQKTAYRVTYRYTEHDDEETIDSEDNYPSIPVVRMYGSRLKQSTLVGMRSAIDAYDMIRSGFANDLQDCAQIYWIVENYGGMETSELREFLNTLKFNHIANADTQSGGKITPYTQEIPTNARRECLTELRDGIYEDYGALDVHVISAGSTNDHIDAAYQSLDENASDFEYWVSDAIINLLALQGIEDEPIFQRNKVSNKKEQVEMVVQEAEWLDEATVLRKLPNITPDEASAILLAKDMEDAERMGYCNQGDDQENQENEEEEEE